MSRTIKFTDKVNNKEMEMFVGTLGQHVFKLTMNVNEMNDAIRWCNRHKVGERFDCDKYSIEIIKEK